MSPWNGRLLLITALYDAVMYFTEICPVLFFLSQVLIATSTLAWGVNFPAHLVVVKGTEYYDGKSRRYVDYPITGTQSCPVVQKKMVARSRNSTNVGLEPQLNWVAVWNGQESSTHCNLRKHQHIDKTRINKILMTSDASQTKKKDNNRSSGRL